MRRSRKDPLLVEIGARVRACRKKVGLTQNELAYQSRLNSKFVGCVERGEKHIAVARLLDILAITKTHPAKFFTGFPKELLPWPTE